MNVQELIDKLMSIKDKSKVVIDSNGRIITDIIEWSDTNDIILCGDNKFDSENYDDEW